MRRVVRALAVTASALSLVAVGACATPGAAKPSLADPVPAPSVGLSPDPATPPVAVQGLGRAPSPTPARTTPTRRPTPTKKPVIPLPPPPPAPAPSGTSCPSYTGPKAPLADVKAALVDAATTPYWVGVAPPQGYTGDPREIVVPVDLIKAVAWQESGWQSTIVACDQGIGTMQVMPGTASFINNRFGTNHDVNSLSGNTALGAQYLEWLTMYFGLYYFGSFDLTVTAPVGPNGSSLRLRDVVIAGYNVGPGAIEQPDNETLKIPNSQYVNNVIALTTNCPCLAY